MEHNLNMNNAERNRIPTSRETNSNSRRQIDTFVRIFIYKIYDKFSQNKICSNDEIFRDNENDNKKINSSPNRIRQIPQNPTAFGNSVRPNILSEKKITQEPYINNFNNFNMNTNKTFSTNKNFQLHNKENIVETSNFDLQGDCCDINKDYCEVCNEILIQGEIVYCCLCSKFYHPNCLIYLTNSCSQSSIIHKQCEDCLSSYLFGNYELTKKLPLDSTNESNKQNDGSTNANLSLIDTNINNLENYNEMCGIAFYASDPESLAEIINRKNESICVQPNEEIERIALSPITITTTPYSGKTKKQISSNCKVEDYVRLQNTHTTPNNKHLSMSGVSRVMEVLYEQSPEESLHGIRQHLSFYSPHNLQNEFNSANNQGVQGNTNQNLNILHLISVNGSNLNNSVINNNIQKENYTPIAITRTNPNQLQNNTKNINININNANKNNIPVNITSSNRHSLAGNIEGKSIIDINTNLNANSNFNFRILNSSNLKSKSNLNLNKLNHENKTYNMDIDAFFKSINFVGGNKLLFSENKYSNKPNSSSKSLINYNHNTNTTSVNQLSFKKLNFDDIELEDPLSDKVKENEFSSDKENSPPLPRESSKFSYIDPEINNKNMPVEMNIEGGISHIISNRGKIVEIPITVDFKFKENMSMTSNINLIHSASDSLYPTFTKDYIILFNTSSLNIENLHQIFRIVFDKMSEGDRVFTNIFKLEKWLNKDDLSQILGFVDHNQKTIFESFIQDTSLLNFSEIVKLINYCVDLSFEYHSNIFSIILINDVDEIPFEIEYLDEMKLVADKLKNSKVNLIKNFTINCVLLDNGKIENLGNIKYVSFLYDLSLLCMGYFYAPKDFNELNKSIYTLMSIFEQSCLLNMKANIKGNKDPSVFIEILNYPNVKKEHNNFDVYLGSLLKKEKKYLNMTAVVILNSFNISLNLPLIEVKLEFLSTKNFKERETTGISTLNSFCNVLNLSGANNLVKNKTSYYQISIPVITLEKEVQTSHSVFMRNCCAKIGDKLKQSLENLKKFEFQDSLNKLYECKTIFGQTLENQTGLMKIFKNYSDIRCFGNFTQFSHLSHNFNQNNSFQVSNFSYDDSLNDIMKNLNSMTKIFNFCFLILQDINNLIDIVKSRQINLICDFFATNQSLLFYRPVNLIDDRFLEDMIE